MTVRELTLGERLQLKRRREGVSQRIMAQHYKVALFTYGRWERDQETAENAPQAAIGALKSHEQCYIARQRSGMSQEAVAKAIGRCRYWVNRMERGQEPCDDLSWYWFQ